MRVRFDREISLNSIHKQTSSRLATTSWDESLTRLGDPVDGRGALPPANTPLVLEREAGDLARRAPITKQLITGYSMIDTVLPIGKGQRQLLMGPIQSGTDAFCQRGHQKSGRYEYRMHLRFHR